MEFNGKQQKLLVILGKKINNKILKDIFMRSWQTANEELNIRQKEGLILKDL